MTKVDEEIKKTVVAHGTASEISSEKTSEETSKEMIEKKVSAETEQDAQEKAQAFKKVEKKEAGTSSRFSRGRRPPRKTREEEAAEALKGWEPKTKLGREVKDGKVKNIDEILDANKKILEAEIVDTLVKVGSDLISIGQSKGKFGGGKRRAWRQTQRKTKEGNVPTFSTMAVVGDFKGHVGIGSGSAKETLPARDKAIRKAKLNIIKVQRACSAFDCACSELHTIPFEVTGKAGSVIVTLIPAPQGTGLVVANELKKILKLAGIKDVYSKTQGRLRTTFNLAKACMNALSKTASGREVEKQ